MFPESIKQRFVIVIAVIVFTAGGALAGLGPLAAIAAGAAIGAMADGSRELIHVARNTYRGSA